MFAGGGAKVRKVCSEVSPGNGVTRQGGLVVSCLTLGRVSSVRCTVSGWVNCMRLAGVIWQAGIIGTKEFLTGAYVRA